MDRFQFVPRGLVLSVVIMCAQAANLFPILPWQATITLCLVLALAFQLLSEDNHMDNSPRPTLEELRAAMKWWNGLDQETKTQNRVAMQLPRGRGPSASEIARYWVSIGRPGSSTEDPKESAK